MDKFSRKTSVTWLRETCARFRAIETYNFYETPSPAHNNEPYFQCRLNMRFNGSDYEEVGNGRTKREAKRAAAQVMLNSMQSFAKEELNAMNYHPSKVVVDKVDDTLDDGFNPISSLQELCVKIRRPQPTYELVGEYNAPHDRTFRIACLVGNEFVEYADANSKKIAKREAARNMETFLKSKGVEITSTPKYEEDDDRIIEEIKASQNSAKKVRENSKSMNPEPLKLFPGTKTFGYFGHPHIGKAGPELNKLLDQPDFIPEAPFQYLRELGKEQNFQVEYLPMEDKTTDETYQCFLQLSLEPVAFMIGEGSTMKEAKRKAALDALQYIRKMMVRAPKK